MMEATRAQLLKWVVKAMVVVNMRPMLLKAIGRKACLWNRGPFWLLKDLEPKRRPNIWRRKELKEASDFMKVEDEGMHYNIYDGHCMKQ
jgi:hypothetical protein